MSGEPHRDGRSGGMDDELKLAGFYVGTALYGIEIMRIKEVIQARPHPVRPVPYAPAIVEGVIQLRGVVIPVVDLRRRFNSPIDPTIEHLNKLIIVSVAGRIAGLKVDRVLGELRVPTSTLRPAPSMLRPEADRGSDNIFSGVSRIGEDNDRDPSRERDKDKEKDRTEMVFVINLDVLLRGSGGR